MHKAVEADSSVAWVIGVHGYSRSLLLQRRRSGLWVWLRSGSIRLRLAAEALLRSSGGRPVDVELARVA